jgi:hypothetical protein
VEEGLSAQESDAPTGAKIVGTPEGMGLTSNLLHLKYLFSKDNNMPERQASRYPSSGQISGMTSTVTAPMIMFIGTPILTKSRNR